MHILKYRGFKSNRKSQDAKENGKLLSGIKSNEEYMERLTKSDKEEYDILKLNMQMAESESKRAAIRQAMADMRKDRVIKDTENKAFYEKQQKEHNENSRKILNSIFWFLAIGSGVGLGVYYGRPMLMAGKRLTV